MAADPAYYAGDRAPIAVAFDLPTGAISPATIALVRVIVRLPGGTVKDWRHTPTTTTADTVTIVHDLASDGSDAPTHGTAWWEAYYYASGGSEPLAKTIERSFPIGESRIDWPDPL